jgi:uncharacterized protein
VTRIPLTRRRAVPVRALATLLAGACAVLAACGSSPPTRYYTLDRVPSSVRSTPADQTPVRLEHLTIPAELDRRELVRHVAPEQLEVSGGDRWAAPLDDLLVSALSSDLAERLPPGLVADPREPPGATPRRLLYVEIVRLYADASCNIELQADWTLDSPHEPSRHGSETIATHPGGACPQSQPAGMSAALGELSDRLAAAVAREH